MVYTIVRVYRNLDFLSQCDIFYLLVTPLHLITSCVCYLQLNGERNYHIFYRLLAGMSASELAKLHLISNPRKYDYLTKVTAIQETSWYCL